MDAGMVQKVIDWVENNVGERTSKQELMSKAQGSDLPQEGKQAIDQMPEGEHSKQDVKSYLQDYFMQKMGTTGMTGRGGMGSPGGMGL